MAGGSARCKVSSTEKKISQFKQDWDKHWQFAHEQNVETEIPALDEPLALTADLLAQVAPESCSKDHIDESSCAWYHGSWQYLRLLDLVSTPTWHNSFYASVLREKLGSQPVPRVLISGTADYSLLAYVIAAAQDVGCAPDIDVAGAENVIRAARVMCRVSVDVGVAC